MAQPRTPRLLAIPRPLLDDCHPNSTFVTIDNGNLNVGDLLNTKEITWGWFQGGFAPTGASGGAAVCGAQSFGLPGTVTDYVSHHEPFMYYPSTANKHHTRPASVD